MKKIINFSAIAIVAVLFIISGCGESFNRIKLSPDGYGKTVLSNGITFLVNHDNSTSLSAARILVGGGVLSETADNNGITNLMIRMLLKGNVTQTAAEINEQLDFLGANVSVACYRDYSAISFVSLTENFDKTLEIISSCLLSPTFPEEELAKLKHEVEGEIKASDDNQYQAASKLFWKTAYGDAGYGLPTLGTAESIAGITVEDLKNHYQKYVGGSNLIFSISTDLPVEQISSMVNDRLGDLKAETEKLPVPELMLQTEKDGFISYDRNQSFLLMGIALDHLAANETPYLYLLHEIMGGNVGSRLWYLRQKEKLAYSVFTQYALSKYSALFRAGIGTDTSKVQIALASLNREWKKMIEEGFTEAELTDARINMKNSLIYEIDRKSNRANNMAFYEYIGYNYRYPLDLIEMADKITLEQFNNFIKERFTAERRYISIVGKK
ncbi:MAG TPA: insulinase family protein [candidate division Zixibacteria bacterium]|nr:insulinase family protein [candidate division Zixibacteria bacterium]